MLLTTVTAVGVFTGRLLSFDFDSADPLGLSDGWNRIFQPFPVSAISTYKTRKKMIIIGFLKKKNV